MANQMPYIKPTPASFLIEGVIVAVFCACFACFVISHASHTSATYDETAHLPSGYSYWLWHDYRMNPEHPPLIKLWAALPLLRMQVWPSRAAMSQQSASDTIPLTLQMAKETWASGLYSIDMQWRFGHCVLYGVRDEPLKRFNNITEPLLLPTTTVVEKKDFFNDADRLLFWGRMSIMLLGVLLAVMIFLWARQLYGLAGGVLALAFFCFDPNFIANSGLVTTDVGLTVFMFGAVYFFWRVCRRIKVTNIVPMLLFFGAAFASKYTAMLLVLMFILIGLGRIFSADDWLAGARGRCKFTTRKSKALVLCGLIAASLAAAYGMVWMAYGFRYSAAADPDQAALLEQRVLPPEALSMRDPGHLPIERLVRRTASIRSLSSRFPQRPPEEEIQEAMGTVPLGMIDNMIMFAREKKLLPEAYLCGFAFARMNSFHRGSFLLGRYSNRGFWYYFPMAFMLKTPLLTLIAIGAALFFAFRRKEPWRSPVAFFLIPAGIYLLASMSSNLNIGHRHLLPVYPFLFVMCGGLAVEWMKWKHQQSKKLLAAVTIGAIAASSLVVFSPPWKPAVVFPHYLAYFNELAGGPRNGYRVLVDSNLDWGQDLKELMLWARRHRISESEPLNLCYFGMADPRYYQIPHIKLPGGYGFEPPERGEESFDIAKIPGYVAISATNLQGAYFSPQQRAYWREFLKNATVVDTLGYSIFIYRIERSPQ